MHDGELPEGPGLPPAVTEFRDGLQPFGQQGNCPLAEVLVAEDQGLTDLGASLLETVSQVAVDAVAIVLFSDGQDEAGATAGGNGTGADASAGPAASVAEKAGVHIDTARTIRHRTRASPTVSPRPST